MPGHFCSSLTIAVTAAVKTATVNNSAISGNGTTATAVVAATGAIIAAAFTEFYF